MTDPISANAHGRGPRLLLTALSLLGGLALAGCSGQVPWSTDGPSAASSWAAFVQTAKDGGASEAQLAALSDGKVTFPEYEDAVNLALDCLRTAGIDVIGGDVVNTRGFPEIDYSYAANAPGLSVEQTDVISQACLAQNSQFVETSYQLDTNGRR